MINPKPPFNAPWVLHNCASCDAVHNIEQTNHQYMLQRNSCHHWHLVTNTDAGKFNSLKFLKSESWSLIYSYGINYSNCIPQLLNYSKWFSYILKQNPAPYSHRTRKSVHFHFWTFDKNTLFWGSLTWFVEAHALHQQMHLLLCHDLVVLTGTSMKLWLCEVSWLSACHQWCMKHRLKDLLQNCFKSGCLRIHGT